MAGKKVGGLIAAFGAFSVAWAVGASRWECLVPIDWTASPFRELLCRVSPAVYWIVIAALVGFAVSCIEWGFRRTRFN